MKTIRKSLGVLFFLFMGINLFAQTQTYVALYENTDQTVYRDNKDRLVMSYKISGPETEAEVDEIRQQYSRYGIFESFSITPSPEKGVWNVEETTIPGIKLKMHKKLFVIAGITTVFVNGESYPVESFKRKMLQQN